MKKIIIIGCLTTSSLFAGWYDDNNRKSSDSFSSSNSSDYSSRGYSSAGDDNYANEQIDEKLHGKQNHYQGSRAGDDDWGDRNLKRFLDEKK